jgi:hypothetical protein
MVIVFLPTNYLSRWIPIQRMGALCADRWDRSPPIPLCTHRHRPFAMPWQCTGSHASPILNYIIQGLITFCV